MSDYVNLIKGQDEETYKQYAKNGMDLMFPVTVNGKTHRPDINVRYHNTIKLFNPEKDNSNEVHEKANQLNLTPPNPKEVGIEPAIIEGHGGYKMHVLRMHGPHAEDLKQHNKHFEGHGNPQNYEYHPHVTVDKDTWDRVKASGAKTAHEAGLSFGPAELRHGTNILARYSVGKLAASENLEKGFKHVATAIGMAGAMAIGSPSHAGDRPPAIKQPAAQSQSAYSSKRMLNTIASVESQHGKYVNHPELKGIHSGERAFGKYGLTPVVIRETIHMNSDLKNKHKKAMNLKGHDLEHYMQDNPGLEDAVAERHLKRLEHHFGADPESIGFSWLNGISGTYKAKKQKQDISNHWHVKKIKDAYAKEK